MSSQWEYPPVRRDENFYEELHGYKIYDPYRWLEDPDSEETKVKFEHKKFLGKLPIEAYVYLCCRNFYPLSRTLSRTRMNCYPRLSSHIRIVKNFVRSK